MRYHPLHLIMLLVLIITVGACGSSDDEESVTTTAATATTTASAPQETEPPTTDAPSTTSTTTAEPTAASDATEPETTGPETDLAAPFRDEFDGELLVEAGWTWLNEDPDGWRIENGRLEIDGATTDLQTAPVNVLTRELPPGLDVSVQVQLAARESNVDATGLAFIGEETVAAVLLGYCDSCPGASPDVAGFFGVATDGDDDLLTSSEWIEWFGGLEEVLSLEWSPEADVVIGSVAAGDNPRRVFRLEDAPTFDRIALVAFDFPDRAVGPELVSRYDWVEFRSYS